MKKDFVEKSHQIDTSSRKLLFLSGNRHKYEEIKPVAAEYGFHVEILPGYKLEIQSDNLAEITVYSALHAYSILMKPVLVEDAGLFITALNGFPGPYSSFVYKTLGVNGILKLMQSITDRRAYFESAVTVIYPPCIITETARVHGVITYEPRGDKGFGFDPIFIPNGDERTFAEMSIEEKNKYSHRAKSIRKTFDRLSKCLETIQ